MFKSVTVLTLFKVTLFNNEPQIILVTQLCCPYNYVFFQFYDNFNNAIKYAGP